MSTMLKEMKMQELRAKAKELGITVQPSVKKVELIEILRGKLEDRPRSLDALKQKAEQSNAPEGVAQNTELTQAKIDKIQAQPQAPSEYEQAQQYMEQEQEERASDERYQQYKQLPPPIVEHLEKTFKDWLNYIEIKRVWRDDYGGDAICILVPQRFSTEFKKIRTPKYDNETMRIVDEKEVDIEDIRWKSLKNIDEAKKWIDLVKGNLIKNAYRAGIQLPSTNAGMHDTAKSLEEYEKTVAGLS